MGTWWRPEQGKRCWQDQEGGILSWVIKRNATARHFSVAEMGQRQPISWQTSHEWISMRYRTLFSGFIPCSARCLRRTVCRGFSSTNFAVTKNHPCDSISRGITRGIYLHFLPNKVQFLLDNKITKVRIFINLLSTCLKVANERSPELHLDLGLSCIFLNCR